MELDENPFLDKDLIFKSKHPLKKDSFEPERIFHRDEEIRQYTNALQDIVEGHDPNNVFVYGPTGVGKTAVTKWIRGKLREKAEKRGVDLQIVGPQNCRHYKTSYRLVTALVNEIRRNSPLSERDDVEPIAESGFSTDRVFKYLYNDIEELGSNVLVILDEIDNIPSDARNDFLYDLPRAADNEDTPIENAEIGIIGISNDLKFVDALEPKVKSTLGEREIEFGPYDANELRDILEYYADLSFREGVLDDGVVPLAAAHSAQQRGDVRQGLLILEKAGEYARMDGSSTVTEEHTQRATEDIEKDEIMDYYENKLSIQQGVAYLATTLMVIEPEKDARTKSIYNLYNQLAHGLSIDPVSERKFYEFLDQLSMFRLVRSEERNLGIKGGRKFVYEVTDDPEDIIQASKQHSRLRKVLPENVDQILKHYKEDQSTSFEPPKDSEQKHLYRFN